MPRTKNFNPQETLLKAMNLFWQQGYHSTSMQDLVECLGINRASMYDTFGSKQNLFLKSLELYQEKVGKEVSSILYYYTNVRQGLYVLYEYFIDSALKNGFSNSCFHVNTISELARSNPEFNEKLETCRQLMLKMYQTYLEYGVNQGQISSSKNIEAIAEFLYSFQCGLLTSSKIKTNKDELMKEVSTCITILD